MISAATRLAVVLGDPVEHSLSPRLHNAAFAALGVDGVYTAMRVSASGLAGAVRTLAESGALGASVTVPHKRSVMACCDEVAESAQRVGAVNCLAFDGERVVGHNTDASGFAAALGEVHEAPTDGWRPLVLGAGGAARAVCAGLSASQPQVIARRPDAVDWIEARPWTAGELATRLTRANLVVDCTSLGLDAERETQAPAPIDLSLCEDSTVVATLIYHRETALLADARARGLATMDGMGMLIHQALDALRLWLGEAPPASVLWAAIGRPPPGS